MNATGGSIRRDGRAPDEVRPIEIRAAFLHHPEGSASIRLGRTWVICAATVENRQPPFLHGTSKGWITAEYGMLPRSVGSRASRGRASGRDMEIQRLIGRSLRAIADLSLLGERTIQIDCDVLQADGGTRTASITGACVAVHDAIALLLQRGLITASPLRDFVAAVSVGVFQGTPVLDLDYAEDSACDTDMNVVMTGSGGFVELQGTAEGAPFSRPEIDAMLGLAQTGIAQLVAKQKQALGLG
jgi:ribonuclease PH